MKILTYLQNLVRNLVPFFFPSQLRQFTLATSVAVGLVNPYPNGRYKYYGKTNGASRKKKSNRLRISKLTRNKHR